MGRLQTFGWGNLLCFIDSDVYFFIGWEGPKSIAKLNGEPLDPFLVLHLSDKAERPQDSVTQGELSTSHAGTCTKRFLKSSAIFLALRLIGLRPKWHNALACISQTRNRRKRRHTWGPISATCAMFRLVNHLRHYCENFNQNAMK